MGNVIKGRFGQPEQPEVDDSYICSMSIYQQDDGRYNAEVDRADDMPPPSAKTLTEWATACLDISFLLCQQAAEKALEEGATQEEADDLEMITLVQVFESARTRTIRHTELTPIKCEMVVGSMSSAMKAMIEFSKDEDNG